eukprot:2894446-Amphidinium_carterae.1
MEWSKGIREAPQVIVPVQQGFRRIRKASWVQSFKAGQAADLMTLRSFEKRLASASHVAQGSKHLVKLLPHAALVDQAPAH